MEPDLPSIDGAAISAGAELSETSRAVVPQAAQHLSLLLDASKRLNSTLNPKEVYTILEDVISGALDCEGLLVSSFDPVARQIRCEHACIGGKHPDPSGFPPLPLGEPGEGMQSTVIHTGQAMIFGDVQDRVRSGKGKYYEVEPDGKTHELPRKEALPTHSAIMAPIKLDGRVVGVIQVMCDRPGAYDGDDLALLEGIALQTAAATRNAQLYQQLEQMNEQLEARVEERTKDLKRAVADLEGFCYSVSHDLRQPLRAICGSAAMLKADFPKVVPQDCDDHLRSISQAATKMSQLIDDLLNFSRLGRNAVNFRDVDLSQLAEQALATIEQSHPARVHIQEGMTCKGDQQMLGLAIKNLLDNAFKFTSNVEDAQIAFGSEEREGERVYFVRDNGVGFEQTYVNKLFRPFERLHLETEYPGTGIGLANVKRVIERHNGRVWAEGETGHGATFYFTIPAN